MLLQFPLLLVTPSSLNHSSTSSLKTMSDRIEKIKAFLKDAPTDSFLNHALALEYVKEGDEEGAKRHFELNLLHHPEYVATYYHLGKLLERVGEPERAADLYQKGMGYAKAAKDQHSYNELQSAHDELL